MLRGYGEKGTLLEMQVGTAIVENSITSVQWFSHVQLHDPMDCSMPGFSVHHQLMELAQTHVHQVGDAIQSSHSLSSPSLVVLVDTKVLSCSVLADSLQPFGLQPTRLFCPWDVSGKNIGES